MENWNQFESPECQKARTLLSDYMENTLSGRDAWDVEKHLTLCAPCAQYLREMQATVSLLQAAPRLDTSDDFMARLHARLDTVEPATQGPLARFAGWRDRLADALRSPRVPALSLSLSAVALVTVLAVNQLTPAAPTENPSVPAPLPAASTAANHNVALSASNPFDDPAAANLESQSQNADPNDPNAESENAGS